MLVTVYKHKGIAIQIKSPAEPHELGYTIAHPLFEGQKFDLVQEAIDAIDKKVST